MRPKRQSYLDKYGLLITTEGDGGDSCFFTCHLYIAHYLNNPKSHGFQKMYLDKHVLPRLHIANGIYCRHPMEGWTSDPDRMSRDQLTPLIVVCGMYGFRDRLKAILLQWLKRGMFTYNTRRNGATKENHGTKKRYGSSRRNYNWKLPDFAPTFGAVFIRAFKCRWLFFALWIYDIELLCSAIKKLYWASKSGDDLNFIARLLQAREVGPTFISRLANRIYRRREWIKPPLESDYEPANGPQSAVLHYCSRGNWKYPDLDREFRQILEVRMWT